MTRIPKALKVIASTFWHVLYSDTATIHSEEEA